MQKDTQKSLIEQRITNFKIDQNHQQSKFKFYSKFNNKKFK